MKFMIEPGAFIKMINLVGERESGHPGNGEWVRLLASQDRVCVANDGTVAEMDTVIQEDGQCTVPRQELLQVLRKHRAEPELTIEADQQGLRLAGVSVPVQSYCPTATAPADYQIFFANELGLVSRGTATVCCHGV